METFRKLRASSVVLLFMCAACGGADAPASPPVVPDTTIFPIVFDQESGASFAIFSINPDGTGLRTLVAKPQRSMFPAWSRDHTRIAYVVNNSALRIDLASPTGDSLASIPLTNNSFGELSTVSWSPNGRSVVVGRLDVGIIIVNVDGTGETVVAPPRAHSPSWSPDGGQIAYVSENVPRGLMIVAAAGGSPRWVMGELNGPQWSPDASAFVYSTEDHSLGQSFIFTSRTDGTSPKQLTQQLAGEQSHTDTWPVWSPNGKEIAFLRTLLTNGRPTQSSLVVMKRDGTDLRVIYSNPYLHYLSW